MTENTENQENSPGVGDASSVVGETYNPFQQSPNEVSNEFVTESFFQEQAKPADADKPAEEVKPPDAEVNEDDVVDPLEWLNERYRDQGFKLNSLDDIPQIVAAYNDILTKSKSQDLTPEEKVRLKIGRETGDWTLYDRISTIDTKSITAVDAMKTKFILENPKLPQSIVDKKFEADLNARMAHYDEELATQLLEVEGNEAKAWLEAKKESMKPAEDSPVAADTTESDNKWFSRVDGVVEVIQKDKNRITYEFDEKEVNVDIDQPELKDLRDAMDAPYEWLNDKVLDEDGTYNVEKLAHLILKDMHHDRIVKEAYELGRVHQEQHILDKQRGTNINKPATGAPQNNVDARDAVAQVFHSFRP